MAKLLSFQYNSLYQHGGAGRVLRRLYEGREQEVTSLFIKTHQDADRTGIITETSVSVFPLHRSWMRWRLRNVMIWLRESFFKEMTIKKIREAASLLDFEIIHAVNHGPFCTAFCDPAFADRPLWVSFHDHYSTCSTFEDCNKLWNMAERRLVISRELGVEYQKQFGAKPFEVITDGVSAGEISAPKALNTKPMVIYFAGLLHLDYLPLFRVLADAVDLLIKQGVVVKLVLRGTQKLDFLDSRTFEVDYRQDFVTDAAVKQELDSADLLYLPIKFNLPAFYLYSLSTKMVGYLGSSGSIIYHGPADSAACNLLTEFNAAACYSGLEAVELKECIIAAFEDHMLHSGNAKELAKSQFDLAGLQDRFWTNHLSE